MLQRLKKNKEAAIEYLETKKNMVILVETKTEEINKEKQNNEDEQWEINEKNTIRQHRKRRRLYQ
jgi:adenylate kinase